MEVFTPFSIFLEKILRVAYVTMLYREIGKLSFSVAHNFMAEALEDKSISALLRSNVDFFPIETKKWFCSELKLRLMVMRVIWTVSLKNTFIITEFCENDALQSIHLIIVFGASRVPSARREIADYSGDYARLPCVMVVLININISGGNNQFGFTIYFQFSVQ